MAAVAERPPRSGQRLRHGQESRAKRAAHTGATPPPDCPSRDHRRCPWAMPVVGVPSAAPPAAPTQICLLPIGSAGDLLPAVWFKARAR